MQVEPQENVVNPSGVKGSALVVSWRLKNGDVGLPAQNDTSTADSTSMQVSGDFGGASVQAEGTNDGANWVALHDGRGITIAASKSSMVSVLESPMQIIPVVTGGDDTTDLVVTMLFRRAG